MVGKVFSEFLGHHTAEEAASQLRKSTKDRCVYVCSHNMISLAKH